MKTRQNYSEKADGVKIRIKFDWYESGEKSKKFLKKLVPLKV